MNFFEKNKTVILVAAVLLALLIGGCSAGFFGMAYVQKNRLEQEAVRTAVQADIDGFCEAVKRGDIDAARQFCGDNAGKQMGLSLMDADAYRSLLLDGLSLSEADLTDEMREGLDTLTEAIRQAVLTGAAYDMEELTTVKKDDTSVTVMLPVHVDGCGSPVNIDFSGEIALANTMIANYTAENQKTLMDIRDGSGTEAVRSDIRAQEIGSLFSAMTVRAENVAEESHDWLLTFTVEKDGDGHITSATITDATERGVSETPADDAAEESEKTEE